MILACELVGDVVPEMAPGAELKVRVVLLKNEEDAFGRNILCVISHDEPEGSHALIAVERRIKSRFYTSLPLVR